jgi:hypothetical protein
MQEEKTNAQKHPHHDMDSENHLPVGAIDGNPAEDSFCL